MVTSLGPHTVTVLRAPLVTGDYGNTLKPDWPNATENAVTGCSVQPVPAGEFTVDRDTTETRWQAWLPDGTDLLSTDRITWNGQTYDVDGDVQRWDFPPLSHLVAILKRTEEAPS